MADTGDTRFEVKLGRIRSPSGDRQMQRFFTRVKTGARKLSRGGGRSRGRGHQRRVAQSAFQRRVIVKVSVVRMEGKGAGAQRLHLDYVERDGTGREGEPSKLYNETELEVDKDAFLERGEEDRHQFRVIVSPEDAKELSDLTAYTRDLVGEMERELGTKLDWVAANHYDTGQPHTHLIIRGKRDNGEDLVMPRKYIAHGIRKSAQELVELELGPVSEIEGRNRAARMVAQERFTEIDRDIDKRADGADVDLSKPLARGEQQWRRHLARMRMKQLEEMGLAEAYGKGRWQLSKSWRETLMRMGERGDIIKAMHRAMEGKDHARMMDASSIYDPASETTKHVAGVILDKGVADDINDRAYIVVDTTAGKPVYVHVGGEDRLPDYSKGDIVKVSPPVIAPKPSDRTIADISNANGGIYSSALHLEADKKAKPEFVQAHIRRLEALRRKGHAWREKDGTWRVPHDYLERAESYEREMATRRPAIIEPQSHLRLAQMKSAMGATWLDHHLHEFEDEPSARGFGDEVETARAQRRAYLLKHGIMKQGQTRLTADDLDALKSRDLKDAADGLTKALGKPHRTAPEKGWINGVYREAIDRPSGRFAVIERAKDFSLVPWREVLERNRGKAVAGMIRADGISWRITKGRGIS